MISNKTFSSFMVGKWHQSLNARIFAALNSHFEFNKDINEYERVEYEHIVRPLIIQRAVLRDWQPSVPDEWKKIDGSLIPSIQSMVAAYVERRYGVDPYEGLEQPFDNDDMPIFTLTEDEEEEIKSRHM